MVNHPFCVTSFSARFKKICNRLPEEKLQAIRDLQFGGFLTLNYTEVRHNICLRIEFSSHKHYVVLATDVGLIFSLPTEGHILNICLLMFVFIMQLHYVIKFQIPSVQVPITVPPTLAWTDELIKQQLAAEIREGHALTWCDHVIYTLDCVATLDYELQPSVPINVVSEQPEGDVMRLSDFIISPTNRNVRRH
ncbi:hypothetical protein AAG906_017572 [Vitis piasezkii]